VRFQLVREANTGTYCAGKREGLHAGNAVERVSRSRVHFQLELGYVARRTSCAGNLWSWPLSIASGQFCVRERKEKACASAYRVERGTAVVLIDPDAGIFALAPLQTRPRKRRGKGLAKWGRLNPVVITVTADLIIVIRKAAESCFTERLAELHRTTGPLFATER